MNKIIEEKIKNKIKYKKNKYKKKRKKNNKKQKRKEMKFPILLITIYFMISRFQVSFSNQVNHHNLFLYQ